MKCFCIVSVALMVAVSAMPHEEIVSQPDWYSHARERRQVYARGQHGVGRNGHVFGELGQNPAGLYGTGGYRHNIFDDHRGKLDAQVSGTRVLGPYGDSTHGGGQLSWKDNHASAAVGYDKQLHGGSSLSAQAGGRWPVGKNGELSAHGQYQTDMRGHKDYGVGVGYKTTF